MFVRFVKVQNQRPFLSLLKMSNNYLKNMNNILFRLSIDFTLIYHKSSQVKSQSNFVGFHRVFILISSLLFFNSCTDQYSQGKRIYSTLCSNCHGDDGHGLKKLIPSIITSNTITDPQKLVCTIKNGINADSLDTRLSVMPSHKKLKAAELTNLINYINAEFRKESKYFKISEVERWMSSCK